jgi:serine/threonine protein kinase
MRSLAELKIDFYGTPLSIGEWLFKEELAFTACSRIWKVEHSQTHTLSADKWCSLRELRRAKPTGVDPSSRIDQEVSLLASCDHPHIQSLIAVIADPQSHSVHLLQPLAPFGSLANQLPSLSQRQISLCFAQLADALSYLHSRGIAHRDIKPSNVLCFSHDQYVLTDFSSAAQLGADGVLADTEGSPAFLSPEECGGGPFDARAADVWAFGVSLYFCVFKCFPFGIRAGSEVAFFQTLLSVTRCLERNPLAIAADADSDLAALLRACLAKEAVARPTAEGLREFAFLRRNSA